MPRHPPCTLSNLATPTGRRHSPSRARRRPRPPQGVRETRISQWEQTFRQKRCSTRCRLGRKDQQPRGRPLQSCSRAAIAEVITYVRPPRSPGLGAIASAGHFTLNLVFTCQRATDNHLRPLSPAEMGCSLVWSRRPEAVLTFFPPGSLRGGILS